jgi:hypothetical protein
MILGMQDEVARHMDEVITPILVEVEQKVKQKVMRELRGNRTFEMEVF